MISWFAAMTYMSGFDFLAIARDTMSGDLSVPFPPLRLTIIAYFIGSNHFPLLVPPLFDCWLAFVCTVQRFLSPLLDLLLCFLCLQHQSNNDIHHEIQCLPIAGAVACRPSGWQAQIFGTSPF